MPPEAGKQGPHMLSGHCRWGADALPHTAVLSPLTWGHRLRGEQKDRRPQREETQPSSRNRMVTLGLHDGVIRTERL